ncbi:cytochrome P450 3A8-like [Argonauta hians]
MDISGLGGYGTTLVLVAILILMLYQYGRRKYKFFSDIGLPGPAPTWFVGNTFQIAAMGTCYAFKKYREIYGDYYGIFYGILPYCVITDPEIIQEICVKRYSNFTNRTAVSPGDLAPISIIYAKDNHWKYLRSVLSPFFSAHQLRGMTNNIQECTDTLVEKIGELTDTDQVKDVKILFSALTMDVIAATGFGIKLDSQKNPEEPLVKHARKMLQPSKEGLQIFFTLMFPGLTYIMEIFGIRPSIFGDKTYIKNFCLKLIEERKKSIAEDPGMHKNFLNLMLKAQLKGHETLPSEAEKELQLENMTDWRTKRGMTDDEILGQCIMLFLGGFDTTATTLSFFTNLMALNSEIQEKVYQEIVQVLGEELPDYDNVQNLHYLDMCLDETLRMYPIAIATDRQCKIGCTIKGVKFPEGVSVRITIDALHSNPKYWPEPEKFIPERFTEEEKANRIPFTYLPFGGGPKICLGMRLAKLELKIAAVQMIRNFKILPTEKTEDPIVFLDYFLLSAKNGVWVKFERRQKGSSSSSSV